MFNSDKDKMSNKIETLIGEQCSISGSLNGSGLLKLDGSVEGDILWQDDVILDVSAFCSGNISSKNAFINGKVIGNVTCLDTLTIESLGKICGDIKVKNLVIREGGSLDGKCTMVINNIDSDQ